MSIDKLFNDIPLILKVILKLKDDISLNEYFPGTLVKLAF